MRVVRLANRPVSGYNGRGSVSTAMTGPLRLSGKFGNRTKSIDGGPGVCVGTDDSNRLPEAVSGRGLAEVVAVGEYELPSAGLVWHCRERHQERTPLNSPRSDGGFTTSSQGVQEVETATL